MVGHHHEATLRKLAVRKMCCKDEIDALEDLRELPKDILVEILHRAKCAFPAKRG